MNGDEYKEMFAHAMIGREVMRIVQLTGLMVPRQKPGRKPEAAKAKGPAPKTAQQAEPDED